MTPKERMIAALNFQQPDDYVPIWELEFHLYQELLGKEPVLGGAFTALSTSEKRYAIDQTADILSQAQEMCDFSAITVPGAYWEQGPNDPAYYWLEDEEWRLRLLSRLKKTIGSRCLIASTDSASNAGIPSGADMMDFVYTMEDDPDAIIRVNEDILRDGVACGKRLIDHGVDILCNACDIAFNANTFFTPNQLERFVYPYFTRWNNALRQSGIHTVLHTDGNVSKIIEDIIQCGFQALQCIDPIAGMDIVDLKKKVSGRLALIGNIDVAMLQLGTKDDVEKQTKEVLLGCKAGGGYVLGCCNAVFKGISPDNYLRMLACRNIYGAYGERQA